MASLNKVLLIGNLGSDPEIRSLPSGAKVANFNIATSESYTDKNGNKVDNTEWHRLELWDNQANVAEQYLKKGDSIYVEGRIKSEKYTDANGIEKTAYKIRVVSMQMLGGKRTEGGTYTGPSVSNPDTAPMSKENPLMAAKEEDELPF
jgi:single-strand DNA-binding protein